MEYFTDYSKTALAIIKLSLDDRERIEERAAILEYDANIPREQAEIISLQELKKKHDENQI